MAKATESAHPAAGGAPVRAESAPVPEMPTVDEHKAALRFADDRTPSRPGRIHAEVWKHAAAAALHCWAQCAHHEGKPMRLSAEDYAAAVKAAQTTDARGVPTPHKPALYGAEKG